MRIRPLVPMVLLATACGGGDRSIIQNTGSDTMLDVAQAWAERYQTVNPTTAVAVERRWSTVGLYEVADERIAACWLLPLDPRGFDTIWSG